MRALDIYESCIDTNTCSTKKKLPALTYLSITAVLTCSICIVLGESNYNYQAPPAPVKKSMHPEPIDTQLVVPNYDGWIPPERLKELNE